MVSFFFKLNRANRIKIDKSFIINLTVNPDDPIIVLSIIAMAHQMSRQMIAEGAQTEVTMKFFFSIIAIKFKNIILIVGFLLIKRKHY